MKESYCRFAYRGQMVLHSFKQADTVDVGHYWVNMDGPRFISAPTYDAVDKPNGFQASQTVT